MPYVKNIEHGKLSARLEHAVHLTNRFLASGPIGNIVDRRHRKHDIEAVGGKRKLSGVAGLETNLFRHTLGYGVRPGCIRFIAAEVGSTPEVDACGSLTREFLGRSDQQQSAAATHVQYVLA